MNEYKNIAYQLLWDVAKAVLRAKFVAIHIHIYIYICKEIRKISNNLTLHIKEVEKEKIKKLNVSRRREVINVRSEVNKIKKK